MKTVVGIDVGTQSVKVLFYCFSSKQVVASASSPLELIQDSKGTAEQEASWWLTALAHCMDEIPQEIKQSVMAISVSGQQHGFVPLNEKGEVIAPVKLWCDTSTIKECEEIMAKMGGERACIKALGNAILPGYTAPKILWLKNNKPTVYQKLHTILLPHDYINYHLTNELSMEYGDASGTGLLDIKNRCWNQEILDAIDNQRDLLNCLPRLDKTSSALAKVGTLLPAIAERYGLPANVPIANGGGDNMMGAIGTGNVSHGVVTISLGSSGTVYSHSEKAIVDEQGRLAAFCSSTDGWLPLLCTMNCTLSTELIRGMLNTDLDEFELKVSNTPIGSNGVLTLPFFNGERSPNLPNAKGTIFGLDAQNTSSNNLLRSAMEGACFGLKFGIEALTDNGVEVTELRLTGGGSKSATWRQMLSDICQVQVVLVSPDEGAAFGAALQALTVYSNAQSEKHTDFKSITEQHVSVDESSRCHPIPANVNEYDSLYKAYKKAVDLITPFYK